MNRPRIRGARIPRRPWAEGTSEMPFGIGWPELMIVLVIVLVLFGASRVPEVGKALGKGIREFKSSVESKAEAPAAAAEDKTEAKSD